MKNKHPFWMKLDWRGARPLTLRELIMKSYFKTTPFSSWPWKGRFGGFLFSGILSFYGGKQ